MTVSPWAVYAGCFVAIGVTSRLWVRFKRDRLARRQFSTPLFEDRLLNAILAVDSADGDDPDVLAEIGVTLRHLNRQSFAEEFRQLDQQLSAYYSKLPKLSRPTMRRALIRMLVSGNRQIEIVAARACASIGMPEAVIPLRALSNQDGVNTIATPDPAAGTGSAGESVFHAEIRAALASLESQPPAGSSRS